MVITGIGWTRDAAHGTARTGQSGRQENWRDLYRQLRATGILPVSIRDFGRFDPDSKRVCLVVGLALHDAGLAPHGDDAAETGLLISNSAGAQSANLAYFRDYLSNGRMLGRGNLFIYTLPTSPAAEAAIGYGLRGPLLYVGRHGDGGGAAALRDAAEFVVAGQARTMLCVVVQPAEAVCYVLREPGRRAGLPLETAFEARGRLTPPDRVWAFSGFSKEMK